jgi:hypothetical protein
MSQVKISAWMADGGSGEVLGVSFLGCRGPGALMRILVVCNSRHHSRSTLQLAEQVVAIAGQGEVVALCEPGEENYFESGSDGRVTRVFPFAPTTVAALAGTRGHNSTPSVKVVTGAAGHFERFYRKVASLRARSKSAFVRTLIDFFRNTTVGSYLQQRRVVRHYRTQLALADRLINALAPTVVLAYGDRHIDFELPVLELARRNKIRILLPYSSYSGASGMVKIRKIQGDYGRWRPFSLYRLYAALPLTNQIRDGYFWQRPSILMALNELKLLTLNPWCMGNGPADIVCVDNAGTLERYAEEGVPRSKLHIVGDTAYDALFASFAAREDLRTKMVGDGFIDADRKTVVIALPQFAEQGLMDWPEHWREIESLLRAVCECGQNVLVSLHPRVNPEDYRHLESQYSLRLATDPLKDILPVADVFVAVNSSTVFWSVLCGIPVVVLDYLGLDSSLFADLESLVYVRDRDLVGEAVVKAISDTGPDFSADWRRLSRDQVFDGQVILRFYELTGA